MTSILKREYVEEDESKRMRPTSLGRVVSDMLVKAFPDILESGFTAQFEEDLDEVEEGAENWVKTLQRFYGPFEKDLGEAKKKMPEVKRKGLPTELKCELDGGEMVIKWGRNGEFLACSNYPKCTNTGEFARDEQGNIIAQGTVGARAHRRSLREVRQADGQAALALRRIPGMLGVSGLRRNQAPSVRRRSKTGVACPECKEGEILERRSRRGKIFYGCGRYPKCKFAAWDKVVPHPCPSCGANYMVEKELEAHRHHLAMRQQGMRLQGSRARRRAARACAGLDASRVALRSSALPCEGLIFADTSRAAGG